MSKRKAKIYRVKATWDAEAEVWVATSDDVIGLVAEAVTLEELIAALRVLVPELLELNGQLGAGVPDVPIELLASFQDRFSLGA